jgi:hypothetical protein
MTRHPKPFFTAIAPFLAVMLAGCVTKPQTVPLGEIPAGAPTAAAILADLERTDREIENFRGAVTYELESPLLDGRKRFRGSVRFRRPHDLYVEGNHHITRIPVFKLMCVGPEFLMEFPGNRSENFYQIEGNLYDDVPFSVAPSDIAREMFFSEDWAALRTRDVRLVGFDSVSGVASLEILDRGTVRRRITVQRAAGDPGRWVVIRNHRFNDQGLLIAETTLDGYMTDGEVVFPTRVEAWYPTEETRMSMELRNVRPNTVIEDSVFDIQGRARELRLL